MMKNEFTFETLVLLMDEVQYYKKNSVVLARKRTIPIERSPLVSEASANFNG
jgi:hypothetical protein